MVLHVTSTWVSENKLGSNPAALPLVLFYYSYKWLMLFCF